MKNGRDSGIAMVVVVMVTVVVMVMGTAVLAVTGTDSRIARNQVREVQAQYLAEGAVEQMLARLLNDPDWRPADGEKVEFSNGEAMELTIEDEGPTVLKISATGKVGGANRTVVVRVTHDSYDSFGGYGGFGASEPLVVTKKLTVNNGSFVWGGAMTVESSVEVNGGDLVVGGQLVNHKQVDASVQVGGGLVNDTSAAKIETPSGGYVKVVGDFTNGSAQSAAQVDISGEDSYLWVTGNVLNYANDQIDVSGDDSYIKVQGNLTNLNTTPGKIRGNYDVDGVINGRSPTGNSINKTGTIRVYLPQSNPIMDLNWYRENANTTMNGDQDLDELDLDDLGPIIFVEGDVTLDLGNHGEYSGVGVLVATGDINIMSDVEEDDTENDALALISGGQVVVGEDNGHDDEDDDEDDDDEDDDDEDDDDEDDDDEDDDDEDDDEDDDHGHSYNNGNVFFKAWAMLEAMPGHISRVFSMSQALASDDEDDDDDDDDDDDEDGHGGNGNEGNFLINGVIFATGDLVVNMKAEITGSVVMGGLTMEHDLTINLDSTYASRIRQWNDAHPEMAQDLLPTAGLSVVGGEELYPIF